MQATLISFRGMPSHHIHAFVVWSSLFFSFFLFPYVGLSLYQWQSFSKQLGNQRKWSVLTEQEVGNVHVYRLSRRKALFFISLSKYTPAGQNYHFE